MIQIHQEVKLVSGENATVIEILDEAWLKVEIETGEGCPYIQVINEVEIEKDK